MKYKKETRPGYVRPYTNIARVIRESFRQSKGLLYIHDDLLITKNLLHKIMENGEQWIATRGHGGGYGQGEIYLNGNSSEPTKFWPWGRYQWGQCEPKFTNIVQHPGLASYLKKSERNGKLFLEVSFGQSDMLYLHLYSAEQTEAFLDLLDLFGEHDLFLECAIPTAVSLMQQRFQMKIYAAPLCTELVAWRKRTIGGTKEMVMNCLTDENQIYEAFHPIKLSKWNGMETGYGNWSQLFNYLVLAQE